MGESSRKCCHGCGIRAGEILKTHWYGNGEITSAGSKGIANHANNQGFPAPKRILIANAEGTSLDVTKVVTGSGIKATRQLLGAIQRSVTPVGSEGGWFVAGNPPLP